MDGDNRLAANLSERAQLYLDKLGLSVDDLFHHVIAVMHDPECVDANAGALRMEWPRIPRNMETLNAGLSRWGK